MTKTESKDGFLSLNKINVQLGKEQLGQDPAGFDDLRPVLERKA
jgi:hypothetical protein